MTTSNEELRPIVEAASPGPWKGDRYDGTVKYCVLDANGERVILGDNGNSNSGPFGIALEADEKFLLTFNPAKVKAMLDQIDALEASVAANQKDAQAYKWIAEELICCDYGDNDESKIGWYISSDYRKIGDDPFMFGETLMQAIKKLIKSKVRSDTSTQEVG